MDVYFFPKLGGGASTQVNFDWKYVNENWEKNKVFSIEWYFQCGLPQESLHKNKHFFGGKYYFYMKNSAFMVQNFKGCVFEMIDIWFL